MKKLLQKTSQPLLALAIIIAAITLSSCNKDETCGVHINVVDSNGVRQQYMWVVIDVADNTPPGQKSSAFPVRLNTRLDGFVEAEFKLPAIVQVSVYDSANYQLAPPAVKKMVLSLIPGETVTKPIAIN